MKKISTFILLVSFTMLGFSNKAITNTSKKEKASEIRFFPNPLIGQRPLQIIAVDNFISEVQIFNILGQPVFELKQIDNERIKLDIDFNEKGLFLLQVKLDNGKIVTERLVIK